MWIPMSESKSWLRRNQPLFKGWIMSRLPQSSKTERPDHPDGGPKHRSRHRSTPYIAIFVVTGFFVVYDPGLIHPFVTPKGPRWLSEATLLVGVIITCIFARALLAAEVRAVSLGEKFRDDKAVENLINAALLRIGLLSLWATLVGLISISLESVVPDELTIINDLGVYVTLGAVIGLVLCLYESALIYRSSLKLMWESDMDTTKYVLLVKVPDSIFMIPIVVIAFKLFGVSWITALTWAVWGSISLRPIVRPIGGWRDPGPGGPPTPD